MKYFAYLYSLELWITSLIRKSNQILSKVFTSTFWIINDRWSTKVGWPSMPSPGKFWQPSLQHIYSQIISQIHSYIPEVYEWTKFFILKLPIIKPWLDYFLHKLDLLYFDSFKIIYACKVSINHKIWLTQMSSAWPTPRCSWLYRSALLYIWRTARCFHFLCRALVIDKCYILTT